MKTKGKTEAGTLSKSSSMKSKGKGLSGKKSSRLPAESSLPEFLDVTGYDHERHCPRYCALLNRDPDEDAATSDELDPVQHELEQVLLHNMVRQRSFAQQLNIMTDGEHPCATSIKIEQEEKLKRSPTPLLFRRAETGTTSAVPSASIISPSKMKIKLPKFKPNPSSTRCPKPQTFTAESTAVDSKNSSFAPMPLYDSLGRRRIYFWPQNHMPDKFWNFVGEYCQVPSDEDLGVVQSLVKSSSEEQNSKYFRIPGLGKHYSLRGTEESTSGAGKSAAQPQAMAKRTSVKRKLTSPDLATDPADGEKNKKPPDEKKPRSMSCASDASGSVKNGHSANAGVEASYYLGPLTERLVQALIEENAITSANGLGLDNLSEAKEVPDLNGVTSPNKALVKSLNLGNMAALERRIRKELEDQGLLDCDEDSDEDAPSTSASKEDEVTRELRQRQEELRELSRRGKRTLAELADKGRRLQDKEHLETQLQHLDDELVVLYGKFYSLVPKRKPSSKKERDQLGKLIADRQHLLQQISAFDDV